ncbi:head-tail connector protein [Vibrio sp. E150_018]
MAFLTIDEIKQQTYVSDDDENDYLLALADAAIERIQDYTNRVLYESKEDAGDDEVALIWKADIKLAALMLVAHYYENREEVSSTQTYAISEGAMSILSRYKFIPV